MRTQHKNAIATLRRGHPEETAGHTHNHCALSQLRGVGCVKKTYAYTRQAEEERTQSKPQVKPPTGNADSEGP